MEENKKLVECGETFRQKRKEMGLSLKEAENATSIRMHYLKAIEEGNWEKLISPVYAQGFLKQYSAFLGLDSESMIPLSLDLFSQKEEQDFSFGFGSLEVRGNPPTHVKWFPGLVWFFLFLFLFFSAWFFAKFLEVI